MGALTFIINLKEFMWALFIISIMLLFVYLGYLVYKSGYARIYTIGHSEPFPTYMESYMEQFFSHYNKLPQGSATKGAIKAFIDTHNSLFRGKPILETVSAFKPNDLPYFYSMYIFYGDIKGDDTHTLAILDKVFAREWVEEFYKDAKDRVKDNLGQPVNTTTIGDYSKLKQLLEAFETMRKAIKLDAGTVKKMVDSKSNTKETLDQFISVMLLDKMLNDYFDTIAKAYTFRKSGGRSLALLKEYSGEYKQFIDEQVAEIWSSYQDDVNTVANGWVNFLSSDTVSDFVTNLPLQIAGAETFVNSDAEQQSPHDTEEHFVAIIKAFIGIGKLVMALISVVTDPFSFFRWLLGLIIGLTIYIMYIVMLALSFLFIIPAAIWIAAFKIALTFFWGVLFVLVVIILVFITILDNITGGIILPLFRCENLPDAWAKYPSYCRDNKYRKGAILCGNKCASRYFPNGWLCKKLPTSEPSYCPQQLVYNAYLNKYDDLKGAQYIYNYNPTIDYYTKFDTEQRRNMWREIFGKRIEFQDACATAMQPYDDITRCMCNTFAKDDEFKKRYPEYYQKLMELCKLTYCKEPNDDRFTYCSAEGTISSAQKENDIILTFISYVIIFILFTIGTSVFSSILMNPEALDIVL